MLENLVSNGTVGGDFREKNNEILLVQVKTCVEGIYRARKVCLVFFLPKRKATTVVFSLFDCMHTDHRQKGENEGEGDFFKRM